MESRVAVGLLLLHLLKSSKLVVIPIAQGFFEAVADGRNTSGSGIVRVLGPAGKHFDADALRGSRL